MPIEIKELNIKAYIDNSAASTNNQANTDTNNADAMDMIIAACVEQVLQIIKDKEER